MFGQILTPFCRFLDGMQFHLLNFFQIKITSHFFFNTNCSSLKVQKNSTNCAKTINSSSCINFYVIWMFRTVDTWTWKTKHKWFWATCLQFSCGVKWAKINANGKTNKWLYKLEVNFKILNFEFANYCVFKGRCFS